MVEESEWKKLENGKVEKQLYLTEDELANLNYRLRKEGFETPQQLIDAIIAGKWPKRSL